jgi:hypothetical protein
MTASTSGVMVLTSPTGYDDISLYIFQDNEALTGSVSGPSFALADSQPSVNKSGRLYPDSNLIEYQGVKYCKEHFCFRFKSDWLDDQIISTNEPERGK